VKLLRIVHKTEYHYNEPVRFGPHRVMMRSREGHDVQIVGGHFEVHPRATLNWKRDIHENSIAVVEFAEPSDRLTISAEALIEYLRDTPVDCLIDPDASEFPFQYAPEDQLELVPYRLPSYPYDRGQLREWLQSLKYNRREEASVQTPSRTLALGTGSCRDYAVLMMEAARHLGFGARFVSGYIQMAEGQHGATHAWTGVYIPGAGWNGFDPTNNKRAGSEHIAAAVAREQEKASPVSASWFGPNGALRQLDVSVQVVEVKDTSR
jgi:transglutaminase-like putative cysteine protease